MPDEGSFLQAILTTPTDDLPRLVYADWLDEQQTAVGTMKAEYLRLTAAAATKTRKRPRSKFELRMSELARILPTDWLAVVSRLGVENCRAAGNSIRQPLQTVQFEYQCPRKWEGLTPTDEAGVRHCEACQQNVYYCDTITLAREHARQGHCVAVDVAIPRKERDLNPPRLLRMGLIFPTSRTRAQIAERVGRVNEPDEVSKEGERAKRGSRRGPGPNHNDEEQYGGANSPGGQL